MADYQFGIIGGGNMAEAILRGLARSHSVPHHAIVAFDPLLKRRQVLAMEFGIICAGDNSVPGACPRVSICVSRDIWSILGGKISETLNEITLDILVRMKRGKSEKSVMQYTI
jgi:hypothetical protein